MPYRIHDIDADRCFEYKADDMKTFDKQIALVLTKLCFEHNSQETYLKSPIDVFKHYWRELATMV